MTTSAHIHPGDYFSAVAAAEAAKAILHGNPKGLREEMLLHLLLVPDLKATPLGAYVYGGDRDTSINAGKVRAQLKRTKGMRRTEETLRDGTTVVRWSYKGPVPRPRAGKTERELVENQPAPRRQCRGCRAILRRTNADLYCDPCQASLKPRSDVYTRERLIADLQSWHKEHGRKPTAKEWDSPAIRGNRASRATYTSWFGWWPAALDAAGLTGQHGFGDMNKLRSEKHRRRVIAALPGTVGDVAARLGDATPTVGRALRRLEKKGYVVRETWTRPYVWRAVESEQVAA